MARLFRIKGFFPYISIVFLNAFVDLGHKIVIQNTIFKTHDGTSQVVLTAIVNGLILLPFVMFFTPSGYFSDRYPKHRVMQVSAWIALVLVCFITIFYAMGWFWHAFAMTFLLALQSAVYSPAKYGYIKELVGKNDLAAANGLVQAVTIVSILMGIFIFSILFEMQLVGKTYDNEAELLKYLWPLGFGLIFCTMAELALTYMLVPKKPADRRRRFGFGAYLSGRYLRQNLATIFASPMIWQSIIGLSVFWGISQVVLAAFPAFAKEVTGLTDTVQLQGAMAGAGIGIMLGSLIAGRVSRHFIETGLVPVGAAGIVLCLLVLPQLTSIPLFFMAFLGLGLFGGLFIVPLNSLIQFHAGGDRLGTVLAGNNFIQNVVMLSFLGLTVLVAYHGLSSFMLLYLMLGVAIIGTIYTVTRLPQSLVRYLLRLVIAGRYRMHVRGFEHLPGEGPALLVANHVSLIDWALIQIAIPRPVHFIMKRDIHEHGALKHVMDFFAVIPITSDNADELYQTTQNLLAKGELVCLFPEGSISKSGQLGNFERNYRRKFPDDFESGQIIPIYLGGLWGSRFSQALGRAGGRIVLGKRDIDLSFGAPLPMTASGPEVKQAVLDLSIGSWEDFVDRLDPLPQAWFYGANSLGGRIAIADAGQGAGPQDGLSGRRALTGAISLARIVRQRCGRDRNIGILLPPGRGGALANMAVLTAGRTVVNLNYTAAPEALKASVELAEIGHVFTSRLFLTRLKQRGFDVEASLETARLHYLEDVMKAISPVSKLLTLVTVSLLPAGWAWALFGSRVKLEDTAAILFSSGSEGAPKGVMLSHRNLMANVKQTAHILDTRDSDVMMGTLPVFHAFGLTVTTMLPLIEGIPVVCVADPTDAPGIARAIAASSGTILCGTSTLFRFYNRSKKVHPLMLDSLRMIVAGAEKLSPAVRAAFEAKFGKEIYEGYGATETGPVASVNIPDHLDTAFWTIQKTNKPGTVGMPLPGTNFRITDPDNDHLELPIGEAGMIFIGGPQVMQGYLKQPEKTAEVLFTIDRTNWYMTGDKGYLDKDGFLTIVDRYSRFAKLGGEMVSLCAVEERVRQALAMPDLECVAVNVPDSRKGEQVILLVASPEIDSNAADSNREDGAGDKALADRVRQALIDDKANPLMIPARVMVVNEIPKLGSGKTDFKSARAQLLAELGHK